MKRFLIRAACAALLSCTTLTSAWAQEWPAKVVTIIVPFPAGGASDQMGRLMATILQKSLNQTVIVDNKPGANGAIGTSAVAKAAPDGYTLLLSGIGTNAINHGLYKNLNYDSNKDFVHVTQAVAGPLVLIANPAFPAKTFKEFVAHVKANPGKLSYASNGNGSSGQLTMEMLKQVAGLDIAHIPYKGGAPAMTDIIGGVVPFGFTNQDSPIPNVKAGKLRAIVVTSLARNPAYPDVPTIAESGYPGFQAVSWIGLSAPKGTPQKIVDRLHADLVKGLNDPAVKSKLEEIGWVVVGSTPQQFAEFVRTETAQWAKVIKTGDIKVD